MRTTLRFPISLLLAAVSNPFAASAAWEEPVISAPPLLQVGVYHGEEFPDEAESGQAWIALVHGSDRYDLVPMTISVTTVHDEIVDADGEATGKEVSVDASGEVIVLLRRLDDLTPGPITALEQSSGFGGFLYPGQTLHLTAGASVAPLAYFAYGRVEPYIQDSWHALRILDYTVSVKSVDDQGDQIVCELASHEEVSEDGAPSLLFAGDLNRDGRLDLLMDLTTHYNVSHPALFLSRVGADGAPTWEKVAEIVTTGC